MISTLLSNYLKGRKLEIEKIFLKISVIKGKKLEDAEI